MLYKLFEVGIKRSQIEADDFTTCWSIHSMAQGILNDLMVKVEVLIFQATFVILDVNEDTDVPIILDWLFIATSCVLLDIEDGKMTLKPVMMK